MITIGQQLEASLQIQYSTDICHSPDLVVNPVGFGKHLADTPTNINVVLT